MHELLVRYLWFFVPNALAAVVTAVWMAVTMLGREDEGPLAALWWGALSLVAGLPFFATGPLVYAT
jgi:hypothetical protein